MKNFLFILGTRPEAIKLAPIIIEARRRGIHCQIVSTGQHGQVVQDMLAIFDIETHADLGALKNEPQDPGTILARIMYNLDCSYSMGEFTNADACFVQGDTTSTLAGALWAFYRKIPVAYVESGLRSGAKRSPFPEEMHRRMVAQIADYHFCPTKESADNLVKEGIRSNIFVVGNTVIDSMYMVLDKNYSFRPELQKLVDSRKDEFIIMTIHRRENWGIAEDIFNAVANFMDMFETFKLVIPIHMNSMGEVAKKVFEGKKNVILVDPLPYDEFVNLIARSLFVVTDSGGIQEEAPYLTKPVLVVRRNTERTEALHAGVSTLVGVNPATIVNEMRTLLFDDVHYYNMVDSNYHKYGYGDSARKIINALRS